MQNKNSFPRELCLIFINYVKIYNSYLCLFKKLPYV